MVMRAASHFVAEMQQAPNAGWPALHGSAATPVILNNCFWDVVLRTPEEGADIRRCRMLRRF
jgi:hypothetical protein